jgi:mono/diheme cytochrome c family protein
MKSSVLATGALGLALATQLAGPVRANDDEFVVTVVAPSNDFDRAASQPGHRLVAKREDLSETFSQGQFRQGRELFLQDCAMCHGTGGRGNGPIGGVLQPAPTNLVESTRYQFGYGARAVFRTVRYGVQGTGMAGWEDRLNDKQTRAVTAYVRSLQR